MKTTLKITIVILGIILLPFAQATPSGNSGGDAHADTIHRCVLKTGPSISQLIGPGDIVGCIAYPPEVPMNTDSFRLDVWFDGPPLIGVGSTVSTSLIQLQTGTSLTGCVNDAGSGSVHDTGVVSSAWGFSRSISQRFEMTGGMCSGVYRMTVAVSPAVGMAVVVLDHHFAFDVISREYTQFQFQAICNNTVSINSAGLFTTCPQVSIDIADDTTDDGMLTVPGNLTVNVAENITINENATLNGTVGQQEPGFDGSLYILMMVFVLALAHLGETRRDNNYRVIGGFITLVAGFILLWELNRLGFDNLGDNMLYAAIGWMFVHFWIALYLLIPKTWEDETNA